MASGLPFSVLVHLQPVLNTEARLTLLRHVHIVYIPLLEIHQLLPPDTGVKAQDLPRASRFHLLSESIPPLLPLTHSTPATKASLFHKQARDIPTLRPLHSIFSLECSSPDDKLIFCRSLLKSASQQGLLWPLQLTVHFPIFCCLSPSII